jgi:hypothetical protein
MAMVMRGNLNLKSLIVTKLSNLSFLIQNFQSHFSVQILFTIYCFVIISTT